MTAQEYREMLLNFLIPEMLSLPRAAELWFMQDGASSHYATIVRNVLYAHFTDRWIGRRGTIDWPPRSCDLTPMDFFLWGYLKDLVYSQSPRTLADLQLPHRGGHEFCTNGNDSASNSTCSRTSAAVLR